MWERGWSFIKKAGTIITLSTIFVWFTSYFGFVDGAFQMLDESQMEYSILATIGSAICWIFAPLGWATGRLPLQRLQALSLRRTSSARSAYSTAAEISRFTRLWALHSPA